ncbi:putative histone H4-like, partial [Triplophysa rosa]
TSEAVQSASLSFQGINNVHGSDGLSLGVFSVGDGVTNNILQKHLQNTASLFVDQTGNALHTTTTSETTDGGLGDSLNVIAQNFAMTLSASFAETLSSFTSSRH